MFDVKGYLVHTITGKKYEVAKAAIFIGRGSNCDIVLSDHFVSREHALLVRLGESFFLQDLESSNGTRVNGVTLKAPVEIKPGDEVVIGIHRMIFAQEDLEQAETIKMRRRPLSGADTHQMPGLSQSGLEIGAA